MNMIKTISCLLASAAISLAAAEVKLPDINELKEKAKAEWTAKRYASARNIFSDIAKLDAANAAKHAAEIMVGVPSGKIEEQIDFYRCKAAILEIAKDTVNRDRMYADALKLKDLTVNQKTTVLLLPIDSHVATVSKSFEDVEKLCRDALKLVGEDKDARSRIWEKLCTRAQYRSHNLPPVPQAVTVFEEALKQELIPRVRFNIVKLYYGLLLYLDRAKDALSLMEIEAGKMDDKTYAASLYIAAGDIHANPDRYMDKTPDENEYLKAMVCYNRALEQSPDMPAAYEAIIKLSAKTHHMEQALTAYGKLSIVTNLDQGLKNRMSTLLAKAYYEMEDFVNAKIWLNLTDTEKLHALAQRTYYDVSMRLANIEGNYQKASDMLAKLEKCTGDFIQKQKLKRYRKRMNDLLQKLKK